MVKSKESLYTRSFYSAIFLTVLCHYRGLYQNSDLPVTSSISPELAIRNDKKNGTGLRATRKKNIQQVIKTLAMVAILFALCFLPGQIPWLVLDFGGQRGPEAAAVIFKFSDNLDLLHGCLNPIVYGFTYGRTVPHAKPT